MSRSALLVAGVAAALLAGCGAGGGGEGAPVSAQVAHPNGAVLQVESINAGGERTAVRARIMNGRDRDIELRNGDEQSYLLTDAGERLFLTAPAGNTDLTIPAGQTMDAVLVFAGALPRAARTTLVLNANGDAGSVNTTSPRFEIALPLNDAFKGGGGAETTTLSNMRANAATRLSPRAAGAGGLGAGGQATSDLRAVEALKTELGATQTDRGSVVSLPGDVTFDFDEATIREAARPTLDRLAQLVQAVGGSQVAIEGHTDSEGEDAYNRGLSERRATAVRDYLVARGVPAERLTTAGLGEARPVAPNEDDAGRQRNRRVEVILPQTAPAPATPAAGPPAARGTSNLTPTG